MYTWMFFCFILEKTMDVPEEEPEEEWEEEEEESGRGRRGKRIRYVIFLLYKTIMYSWMFFCF